MGQATALTVPMDGRSHGVTSVQAMTQHTIRTAMATARALEHLPALSVHARRAIPVYRASVGLILHACLDFLAQTAKLVLASRT